MGSFQYSVNFDTFIQTEIDILLEKHFLNSMSLLSVTFILMSISYNVDKNIHILTQKLKIRNSS